MSTEFCNQWPSEKIELKEQKIYISFRLTFKKTSCNNCEILRKPFLMNLWVKNIQQNFKITIFQLRIWKSRSPTVESDWRKSQKNRSGLSRVQASYDYRCLYYLRHKETWHVDEINRIFVHGAHCYEMRTLSVIW